MNWPQTHSAKIQLWTLFIIFVHLFVKSWFAVDELYSLSHTLLNPCAYLISPLSLGRSWVTTQKIRSLQTCLTSPHLTAPFFLWSLQFKQHLKHDDATPSSDNNINESCIQGFQYFHSWASGRWECKHRKKQTGRRGKTGAFSKALTWSQGNKTPNLSGRHWPAFSPVETISMEAAGGASKRRGL